jgi:DNA polymerase III subunit epsilon
MIRRHSRLWRETSFAVLDFETTGLDLASDHVLSYGLVPVEQGRIRLGGALYGVVRPPVPVSAESIRVHGILPVELEGALSLGEVAAELRDALADSVLVAHWAPVELAFLRQVFGRLDPRRPRRAIDVLDLAAEVARRSDGPALPSGRLSDLAALHGVPVGRTHHALGDALVTAQLFLVLATKLEQLGRGRLLDLRRARPPQFARNFVSDRS